MTNFIASCAVILLWAVAGLIAIFCIVTAGIAIFFAACFSIAFWSWLFGAGGFTSVCLR